jgi:Flp pilus assembly protein TadG
VVVVSLSRRRLRARRRRGADDARGAVAIIVAASMLVVLGLAAIVVDLGFARDRARVAQNAADAAALAVAICYTAPTGCPDPQGTARAYVTANGWTYSPSTVSVDTAAQTVTVGLQAAAPPGFFAGALGYTNARVGGSARATWSGATAVACALCVLGDFDGQVGDVTLAGSLVVDGDIDFNDPGGTVTVNGPPGTGVFYGGTVTGGSYTVNGTPVTPVARTVPLPDPLAGLTLPPPTGVEGVNLGATATRGPGGPRPVVCPQGNYIDFSACDALQGNGIYIVTGPVGGGAVEIPNGTASNTLVYLTCNDGANRPRNCNPGEKGGYLGGRSRDLRPQQLTRSERREGERQQHADDQRQPLRGERHRRLPRQRRHDRGRVRRGRRRDVERQRRPRDPHRCQCQRWPADPDRADPAASGSLTQPAVTPG